MRIPGKLGGSQGLSAEAFDFQALGDLGSLSSCGTFSSATFLKNRRWTHSHAAHFAGFIASCNLFKRSAKQHPNPKRKEISH